MPFVVAATWVARRGEEERIREVIRLMTAPSRAEPNNLCYLAHVSSDAPGTFFLYEQYTDADAYEAHKRTSHFQTHVTNYALAYLDSRDVKTYYTIEA
jgi:quinol monooxygenase YgiN